MIDGPQIRINVRGFAKETGRQAGSVSGHANITIAFSARDKGVTYGATVLDRASLKDMIHKWYGAKDDGIIRDESEDLENGKYTWVTRAVPVTESQLSSIAKRLEGLKNKKYNYFARPGLGEPPQACTTFAKAILRMTGHDIELGDLFSIEDREKVSGIVWHEIPGKARPESVAWRFRPTEPNTGHYPDVGDIGIKLNDDKHQYGDGAREAEQGFGETLKSPKVRGLMGPLMFPGRSTVGPSSQRKDQKAPETILGAAPVEEHQPDEDEFEGNTILTRRKRRKKKEKFTGSGKLAAVSPERVNGSLLFPNSDHN